MRSLTYAAYGEPAEVLALADMAKPDAPAGRQVLVRVTHRVINPGDLIGVRGGFRPPGDNAPPPVGGGRPGVEGAGVIEAVGPEAGAAYGLEIGARVAFFPAPGAWGEYVLADADNVAVLSDEASMLVGAQLHVAPMTAALLLRALGATGVGQGELVLLSAAGSSVAGLVIEQLRRKGIGVLAVVRRQTAIDELTALFPGLDVVATDDAQWSERVRALADGRPIKAVLDPVAGELAAQLIALMSDGGAYISYGDLSRQKIAVPALTFSARRITMNGVSVPHWIALPRGVRQADIASVLEIAGTQPELFAVAATYDLADAAKAVRHAEAVGKNGAVILTSE